MHNRDIVIRICIILGGRDTTSPTQGIASRDRPIPYPLIIGEGGSEVMWTGGGEGECYARLGAYAVDRIEVGIVGVEVEPPGHAPAYAGLDIEELARTRAVLILLVGIGLLDEADPILNDVVGG